MMLCFDLHCVVLNSDLLQDAAVRQSLSFAAVTFEYKLYMSVNEPTACMSVCIRIHTCISIYVRT